MRRRTFPADRACVDVPDQEEAWPVEYIRRPDRAWSCWTVRQAHLDGNNAHGRRRILGQNHCVSWQGVIRVAEAGDWQLLRDIRLTALTETPTAFASTYERESAFDANRWRERITSSTVLLAFDADRARAIGTATLFRPPDEPGTGEITGCFVRSDWRGSGVAAALIDAVVDRAADVTRLALWVSSDNPRAAALYARYGFVRTGETQPHSYPGLVAMRMIRPLD